MCQYQVLEIVSRSVKNIDSDVSLQVSADGEQVLYKALSDAKITMLSIAHRPALREYHNFIVHFTGTQQGSGWHLEELDHSKKA